MNRSRCTKQRRNPDKPFSAGSVFKMQPRGQHPGPGPLTRPPARTSHPITLGTAVKGYSRCRGKWSESRFSPNTSFSATLFGSLQICGRRQGVQRLWTQDTTQHTQTPQASSEAIYVHTHPKPVAMPSTHTHTHP